MKFFRSIKVMTRRLTTSYYRILIAILSGYWQSIKRLYIYQPITYIWILVFLLGYQMVSPFIYFLFNKHVVDGILNHFCFQPFSSFGLGAFITIWFGSLIYFVCKHWKSAYKARLFNCFLLAFVLCLYWSRRDNYIHYPLYQSTIFNPTFGLSDFIAVWISTYSIMLISNLFRHSAFKSEHSVFIQDLPIKDLKQDGFFRTPYFTHLKTELKSVGFDSDKAFAIGINSRWGYGKTSLLKILENVFSEGSRTIYMDYNPWLSSSKSGLTLDFFIQLEEELSKHIETDNLILTYGKALAKFDIDKNPLKSVSAFFEGETSIKDRHDSVADLLKKTNKRFVVTIDDLDRLDNDEVFEVLRLIRNTANFSRIVFVVAYDKMYLVNALNRKGVYAPEKYLEKIYDVEIVLPHIETTSLKVMLVNSFEAGVSGFNLIPSDYLEITEQFRNLIHGTVNSNDDKIAAISSHIWEILRSKRDIIRFINSLLLSYKSNNSFVYLPDLILLELIKLHDFSVYEELSRGFDYLETELVLTNQNYKLRSLAVPTVGGTLGNIGPYDIRHGKTQLMTVLLEALFQSTSLVDRNFVKTIKTTTNFPHYFIFAEHTSQGGGVLNTILTSNP